MEFETNKILIDSITPETANILSNLGEVVIDNLDLVDGVLKEVPIVSSLISFGKIGFNVSNQLFLKKFALFIKASENVKNSAAFASFKKEISNPDKREKVSHHLLEIIDKTIEEEKIRIYSTLFDKYVNGILTWDEFYILTLTVYDLHILGIQFLKEILDDSDLDKNISVPRDFREGYLATAGLSQRNGAQIKISDHGKKLYIYGFHQ
ncbi:hypothetical protein [Leptospira bandrabouensis]|uniref:hypothetical protein n=1 Tax=Leptospira bandrabouensis TaxID=2484903 RepID=UPI001EE84336|nr:hypothetical protein [Leptospira bandrabouensis]MCG6146575.1 hypothetical protein [Leptospira bandrabouensis]MCG6161964.1 hypothetical protein [Leptospira bandrabouensis]MCG6166143.1 hypothetical protein [Leptospira bandrabouensis]